MANLVSDSMNQIRTRWRANVRRISVGWGYQNNPVDRDVTERCDFSSLWRCPSTCGMEGRNKMTCVWTRLTTEHRSCSLAQGSIFDLTCLNTVFNNDSNEVWRFAKHTGEIQVWEGWLTTALEWKVTPLSWLESSQTCTVVLPRRTL